MNERRKLMRMDVELDHVFVCVDPGGPEAEELVRFGLREGLPNTHPGQGTACRRFPFLNAMIELVWVHDQVEAQSEATCRTRLSERWSRRNSGASPFGICLRPAEEPGGATQADTPFPGWAYQPSYLPDPLAFHISDALIREPMWIYMSFMQRRQRATQFVEHPNGLREITGLLVNTPVVFNSEASRIVEAAGVLSVRAANEPILEIEFDGRLGGKSHDFRPAIPLVFHF